MKAIAPAVEALNGAGARVSLFIEASLEQISASADVGAAVVELHTGAYCEAVRHGDAARATELLDRLHRAAEAATARGLEVHAGHGIDYATVRPVAAIPEVAELNIGHFLIGEAIFVGLQHAITHMRALMDAARLNISRPGIAL
jgi:pyridoxine 5-phosphate synthase